MVNHHILRYRRSCLPVYFLLLGTAKVQATSTGQNVTDVTSVATVSGKVFTPTSVSISGVTPPLTAPTTITTTDSAGETVAIAVAAGAGIVAGGGLAAWMFKPVPGAPPAPTSPPSYSTESPEISSHTITTSATTSSSSEAHACPYPSTGFPISFASADSEPQWTAALPAPSTSTAYSPQCTQQGSNKQLLRGTDPGYINALAAVFCKSDLSKDESTTLGQNDLPTDSGYKNAQLDSVRVKFDFKHKITNDGCAQNCVNAYKAAILSCQYDSHTLYGGASLQQGCGSYDFTVDADPNTKLTCNPIPSPIWQAYDYRDAAVDAINNFCTAHDGKSLKQSDAGTNINEQTFSATYAESCTGSGSYTISKDLCVQYLMQTVDSCGTDTTMYKHGGTLTDTDNCGAFSFHPGGYDVMACYPENQNAGYISGSHVSITPAVAKDAIGQFCDRTGADQKYTLDPKNIPSSSSFTQDTCTTAGFAACAYYYNNDGSRAKSGSLGDMVVRMSAQFMNPNNQYNCSSNESYEIHGDRCHAELGKMIGLEPKGNCVGSDANKLDLGSFLEDADKGCVLWNFWAVETH